MSAPSDVGRLRVGMVVYDRAYEMVGFVNGFVGPFVQLSRPTGLVWQSRCGAVRVGTAYERRQLRAIGALHALRHKGLCS